MFASRIPGAGALNGANRKKRCATGVQTGSVGGRGVLLANTVTPCSTLRPVTLISSFPGVRGEEAVSLDPDGNPRQQYLNCGAGDWLRDLTAEGVERNPGPSHRSPPQRKRKQNAGAPHSTLHTLASAATPRWLQRPVARALVGGSVGLTRVVADVQTEAQSPSSKSPASRSPANKRTTLARRSPGTRRLTAAEKGKGPARRLPAAEIGKGPEFGAAFPLPLFF
jgi:hypothetical protein